MIKFWELIMFVKTDLSKETKWDSKKRYPRIWLLKHTKREVNIEVKKRREREK